MVEGHLFHTKTEDGFWLVKCFETDGEFSTKMWALEKVKLQVCPCCNKTIRKVKSNTKFFPVKTYLINDEELAKILKFCRESKDKDLEAFIKKIKMENKI